MKVAVVTGGNKGIGFGVVRALCKKFDGVVYLTSRDEKLGKAAVEELKQEGLSPSYHQFDILSTESILNFKNHLLEEHGGVDVLVNNAGIAFKVASTEPVSVQAKNTLRTNYWGTKEVLQHLIPILKTGARVVNLSSNCGFLGKLDKCSNKEKGKLLKEKLGSETLTIEELDSLMNNYVNTTAEGNHEQQGWISDSYNVSKIGVSALTRVLQRNIESLNPSPDIVLNHVHPGYVDTDMSSHKGPLTIDRGAESSVFAALLPANTRIRGAYIWHDCQVVDWVNGPTPPMT